MTKLPSFRLPVLVASALCLSPGSVAFATFVTRAAGGASVAAIPQERGGLLRTGQGGASRIIRADGPLPETHAARWGLGAATQNTSGGPLFDFVGSHGPIFRTPPVRRADPPAVFLAERSLPRYTGGLEAAGMRRFSIPSAVGEAGSSGGFEEPAASGVADDARLSLPGLDPRGAPLYGAGGVEGFTQTVPTGPVGNWSPSFLGARSNAGERTARVRHSSGMIVPAGAANPLLFQETATADEEVVAADDTAPVPIPEPTTALFGLGLIVACATGRRRRRADGAASV